MKPKMSLIFFGVFLFLGLTQFSGNLKSTELNITEIPKDFTYDGCSLFPNMDMLDCCTTHDKEYFFGGSWQERLQVDNEFFQCVRTKGHWYSSPLAVTMWGGVRIGGSPIIPTHFRWGFGRDTW